MRTRHRLLMSTVLWTCAIGLAPAAETEVSLGGPMFLVSTGTPGGACDMRELGPALGADVECADGADWALFNTLAGCVSTEGLGLCGQGFHEPGVGGSIQLSCPGGVSYNISTGDGVGRCTTTGAGPDRSAECHSAGLGRNNARAECAVGCKMTSGSGCCCSAGTPGCGLGRHCTGR